MNRISLDTLANKLNDPELGETTLPDGSSVLLDVQGHQVLSLSKTAVFLVKQIRDGVATTEGLAERLCQSFRVDAYTARADVDEFLADLANALIPGE